MKNFTSFIYESKGDDIDEQWLNDEKPLMTKDGRTAVVLETDRSEVPNILKGQVQDGSDMFDFEWEDSGKCIKATDKLGNPKSPSDNDKLVKGA